MSRRSFINLISNSVELPELNELPIEALLNREFPVDMILPFLHEITHHWCFNSPVGLAQALLYGETIEMMMLSVQESGPTGLEVRDKFARYLILDDLLEPLYEGVAVFAEQNLTSLESEAASDLTLLTGLHFGVMPSPAFFQELSKLLTQGRRTIINFCRRRRNGPGSGGAWCETASTDVPTRDRSGCR
jgi:hypothetical protein